MIVIGVDPGIEKTGVGIVEKLNNSYNLVFTTLIRTDSKLEQSERLVIIYDKMMEIMSSHKVNHASVERLFFAKNVKTALNVSEARGVILLSLKKNNLPIYEYTPLQVKQALIGYGRAEKSQIQFIIQRMLNMTSIIKPDDVADAVAIALTHINSYAMISKIKKSNMEGL